MEIFVAINNQQVGPLETSDFVTRFAAGTILDTDLAWTEGDEEWSAVRVFSAKHGISLVTNTPPPIPVSVHAKEMPKANSQSRFFSAFGADIRVHIRMCRALERDHWVRWNDGRDEFFELPVEAIPGHEVVVIGLESMPRADSKVAKTLTGEPFFKNEATNVDWTLVINPATGEEWSNVSKWVQGLKTPYADLAIKDAQNSGNDLGRAEKGGNRFVYYSYLVLAPLIVEITWGAIAWWVSSYFVPTNYAITFGVSMFALLFIGDIKSNLRANNFDYVKVKERRVSKVKDGLLVRSTLREIEDWVADIAAPYRRTN